MFRDLGWLATIPSIGGEVGLLVTSTVPQTPFFWAMHITEVRGLLVVLWGLDPSSCGPTGVSVMDIQRGRTLILVRPHSLSHLIPWVPSGWIEWC